MPLCSGVPCNTPTPFSLWVLPLGILGTQDPAAGLSLEILPLSLGSGCAHSFLALPAVLPIRKKPWLAPLKSAPWPVSGLQRGSPARPGGSS